MCISCQGNHKVRISGTVGLQWINKLITELAPSMEDEDGLKRIVKCVVECGVERLPVMIWTVKIWTVNFFDCPDIAREFHSPDSDCPGIIRILCCTHQKYGQ